MAKKGKKYQEAAKLVNRAELYDVDKAFELVTKTATAKFDETVEAHFKITGKSKKVLVFAKGEKAHEAEAAGADYVGAEEYAERIQKENWFDFDTVVATPDMMGIVGRLGKILGPKGLMPNPKSGTVTMDLAKALHEIKAGKVEYRLDKQNIVHTQIGKVSFGPEKLQQNYQALVEAIIKAKPAAAKGQYIKSATVATTMGPGIKINPTKLG